MLLAASPASAQITVNRSVIEFTDEARIQDIELVNTGDSRIYLDMQPAEILDPGGIDPERVALDDPRTAPLLVTPRQLLIGAGERKRVRLILRDGELEQERVFRLAVKPYVGKLRVAEGSETEKSSAIKVLVGYDLLLVARPLPLRPDVQVTRTDEAIEFVNKGNTNVLLDRIRQCDADGESCEELEASRLYVGETLTLKLPRTGPAEQFPVEVRRSVGLENSRAVY